MKTKFFMTLVLALMGMCSLQAQPGQGRRGPEFPSEQMIKELKLTDEQVANIKKENAELRDQMRASRENKEFSREDMKAMMDKIRAARDEMMKKNLTADQYKAYVEFEKNNARNRPQGPRPEGRGPQGNAPTE
jgi:Spy/CpxP family protein refolding chaperone